MKQITVILILIAMLVFGSAWVFNHVNSWAGIGVFVTIIYGIIFYIQYINKKTEK